MRTEINDYRSFKSYRGWLIKHLSKQKMLVLGTLMGIVIVTFSRTLVPVILGHIIDNTFKCLWCIKI